MMFARHKKSMTKVDPAEFVKLAKQRRVIAFCVDDGRDGYVAARKFKWAFVQVNINGPRYGQYIYPNKWRTCHWGNVYVQLEKVDTSEVV